MMHGLLHAEGSHGMHDGLSEWLIGVFGEAGRFLDEVFLHALIDTAKVILFLFLTYLALEIIEHRATDKARRLMARAGGFGPLIAGAVGAVPQCGFSAVAANFYTGRVITLGALVAAFLSTSDEMLPVLLSENVGVGKILTIIIYKTAVGILVGFLIDLVLRLLGRGRPEVNIDEICDGECHCEAGIVPSAIRHTLSVTLYIFVVTLLINSLFFFVGEDRLSGLAVELPVISHFLSAVFGLIPNCAASVALTRLAMSGVISTGSMISGLLSGAGVGLLVLFRMNKHPRENAVILLILVLSGTLFGFLFDLLPFFSLA
nr:arsenic efflux protein [Clostridia bacterium]